MSRKFSVSRNYVKGNIFHAAVDMRNAMNRDGRTTTNFTCMRALFREVLMRCRLGERREVIMMLYEMKWWMKFISTLLVLRAVLMIPI